MHPRSNNNIAMVKFAAPKRLNYQVVELFNQNTEELQKLNQLATLLLKEDIKRGRRPRHSKRVRKVFQFVKKLLKVQHLQKNLED